MAHPFHHALSSVKRWGGRPSDYLPIHEWFDESKQHLADVRHRALRHHTEGIFLCERLFGTTLTNSDGRVVPVRWVGEQHVQEDLGWIPTVKDWLEHMKPAAWMGRGGRLAIDEEERVKGEVSRGEEEVPEGGRGGGSLSRSGASELAALVRGLKDSWSDLPVLADFLEEKFGLGATAALLRSPKLVRVPENQYGSGGFTYYPLTGDVFVWVAAAMFHTKAEQSRLKAGFVIGFYAHPEGDREAWARVAAVLMGDGKEEWGYTQHFTVEQPDPRVEAAKAELAALGAARPPDRTL